MYLHLRIQYDNSVGYWRLYSIIRCEIHYENRWVTVTVADWYLPPIPVGSSVGWAAGCAGWCARDEPVRDELSIGHAVF